MIEYPKFICIQFIPNFLRKFYSDIIFGLKNIYRALKVVIVYIVLFGEIPGYKNQIKEKKETNSGKNLYFFLHSST